MAENPRAREVAQQRAKRAAARDVEIPPVVDPKRRAACEADPFEFLRVYFPQRFTNPFSEIGTALVEGIVHAARWGGDQAIAGPRGSGKSTIVECTTIYLLNTGILHFPVICSATGGDADSILANIKFELETNKLLLADYPEICAPIVALNGSTQRASSQTVAGERTHIRWTGNKIVFPTVVDQETGEPYRTSGAILTTRGLDAAIRGIRHHEKRPDLAIIDDPETRESAASELQTDNRSQGIEKDVGGLGGQTKTVARVMLTTCQNRSPCLSFRYTDPTQKQSWRGKRFKFLKSLPDRTDLWDQYIELRKSADENDPFWRVAHQHYLDNREAMDAGAVATDPHRFNGEALPDGSQMEVSAVQFYYNEVCDKGEEYALTELQNDPPEEDAPEELGVSAALIQGKLSGIGKGIVPDGCEVLTCGFDVGKYACHYVATAWKPGAEGFVIDYGVREVHIRDRDNEQAVEEAIYNTLHEFREEMLAEPYADAEGNICEPHLTLVDSGTFTPAVYRFCLDTGQRGYSPCHGVGDTGHRKAKLNHETARSTDKKRLGQDMAWYRQDNGLWLCMPDADVWKRWLHERFATRGERPGSLVLFGNDRREHVSFSKHCTAETEVQEFIKGKGLKRYWKKTNRNNHYFDAAYMSCVAASWCGISVLEESKTKIGRPTKVEAMERRAAEMHTAGRGAGIVSPDGRDFFDTARPGS